ncbi:hypothetical protein [Yersinia ruckeri]|uniref:hypothetical protein n=1 Tax=Yersinia ruckeri TaxID=29486 RepID=UPI0022372538|nr:hypothetical protein [Yersinia ruckeri]MCW6572900.1 hypothetical protein [Yersinia ruckeri]HDL7537443.1 hypothetical protein [Yersinia enterocolitica]
MLKLIFPISLLVFTISGCDQNDPAAVVGSHFCDFGVRVSTHTLTPYDPISGKDIGFFERQQDGEIQLTTFGGYAPIVTECLLKKGYKNRISMIPLIAKVSRVDRV